MKHKKLILFGTIATLVFAVGGWFFAQEPKLEGKPLSFWLQELQAEEQNRRDEARSTILRLDDAGRSYLIRWVGSPDSYLRQRFSRHHLRVQKFDGSLSSEFLPSGNYRRALAATALGLTGTRTQEAIAALTTVAQDKSLLLASHARAALIQLGNEPVTVLVQSLANSADLTGCVKAASVLYALGTNSGVIANALTNVLKQSKETERFEVVQFLCSNELDAAVAWPVILSCLESGTVRGNALNAAIIHLSSPALTKHWADTAHPAIVQFLMDTNVNVRGNAVAALQFSYPQDSALVPPTILARLLKDQNAFIRNWAEGLENRINSERAR